MKLFLPVFIALLGLHVAARADMVIVQKVEGMGQSNEMTMKIKGDKVRADVNPQISTITDASTGDVTTVMHAQKNYMVIPASASKALMEQMHKNMDQQNAAAGGSPAAAPKLVPTGKKEKINGYDTDQYTCTIGGMKVTYWIAKDFPNWQKVLDAMKSFQKGSLASMTKGMMPEASDFNGMPIKTEVDFNGQKITTVLQSVEEKEVAASDLQVPAGYTETKVPSFNAPAQQ